LGRTSTDAFTKAIQVVRENRTDPYVISRILQNQNQTRVQVDSVLLQFHTAECMFLYHWVKFEDGVVRHLNPLPTMTSEQHDQLDVPKRVLIENHVTLTDDQMKFLIFSIGPYPTDTEGLLNPLISLKLFKKVNKI
jgi:hypothetical protein